ncbi:CocE/NonD family hydrolase [Rhizobium sp.]
MGAVVVSGVRTVETHWITMRDGRRLAARLFLPEDALDRPVPLILEYIPYRRRDGTRTGDDEMHLYFAAHGYACARVDIAGTGDSEGLLDDEYVKREQDDGMEVLVHLCAEPWCTGVAGMIGISWGGFSGLQIAARRPPQLKAIVTACSTDDRYGCDAHYNGGLLINDNFGWGGALFSYAALPPDPAIVGEDRWREMWKARLDDHKNHAALWLQHQRRDAFWKHGSVCEDYGAIACPVLAVGGFLDGYAETIFRLVENLGAPVKGICGPWGHKEPQAGVPGPAIGYLQACIRWYDRWLKNMDNGADRDPDMRLYLMDHAAPRSHMPDRPGRWLGFPQWPAAQIADTRLHLGSGGSLRDRADDAPSALQVSSPLTTGVMGQEWCPYGQGRIAAEGARDQRADDGGSLCFDTAPLERDLSFTGTARMTLRIAADRPQAQVCVRLTDVAPDGSSAHLTFVLLNLAHRRSHEFPTPLTPGVYEDVDLVFKPTAQVVPKGHRLRVAISSSYWPMAWPSPERTTLSVDPAGSHLDLPVLASEDGLVAVEFGEAVHARPGAVTTIEPSRQLRSVGIDVASERTVLDVLSDDGRFILEETGTEIASWRRKVYGMSAHDPESVTSTVTCHEEFRRPDWHARVDSEISFRCDRENFYAAGWVRAYDGGQLFAERHYEETIPRDCL